MPAVVERLVHQLLGNRDQRPTARQALDILDGVAERADPVADEADMPLDAIAEEDASGPVGGAAAVAPGPQLAAAAAAAAVQQWSPPAGIDMPHVFALVRDGQLARLRALVDSHPQVVNARSKDGRGALFWAYEYKRADIVGE
jgi:hypothetical protein